MGSSGATLQEIEDVYRRRGREFFRLARARVGGAEAASDAVQEGFANVVRGRASFRREGLLDAWVARCVVHAARDASRDPLGRTAVERDEGADFATDDGRPALRAAIRRLPSRQRDVLFLRYYLDFDYAAIAQALHIEVRTVSATLHAAHVSLRDSLQEVYR